MPPLTPKYLAAEWKKESFRPAYMLFGEDAGSKSVAVQTLRSILKSDEFNTTDFSGDQDDQAEDIASTCATPPMFSPRRLVVVRNAKFGAAGRKRLAEYLRSPLESTTLIMISEDKKPAAKDALAAAVEALGGIVLFKPLNEVDAIARLQNEARKAGIGLETDAAELLVEEAGREWGILRSELEKIKLFTKDKGRAETKDVLACLGYHQQINIFDLPKFIERRDAPAALRTLRTLLKEGQNTFSLLYRITAAINKQLKTKRLLKTGATTEQIAKDLRIRFGASEYVGSVSRLGENVLIRSLRHCLDTEVALKSKSWIEPSIELENLVLKVCGKA